MIFIPAKHRERKIVSKLKKIMGNDELLYKDVRGLKAENVSDPAELITALDKADIENRILKLRRQIEAANKQSFISHHQFILKKTMLDKEQSKELAGFIISYFKDNTPCILTSNLQNDSTVIDLFLSDNAELNDKASGADIDKEILNKAQSVSKNEGLEMLYSSGTYSYYTDLGNGVETCNYGHDGEVVKSIEDADCQA